MYLNAYIPLLEGCAASNFLVLFILLFELVTLSKRPCRDYIFKGHGKHTRIRQTSEVMDMAKSQNKGKANHQGQPEPLSGSKKVKNKNHSRQNHAGKGM